MNIIENRYKSEGVISGILHFGVGNFHRAHQAYYANELLMRHDHQDWGICGVSLMKTDAKIIEGLRAQNLNYTLTVCASNGDKRVHQIGAITELLVGYEDPQAVIAKIASKSIRIISLTITEGGYNLDKETGEFILNNENISHDLQHPNTPATVFGFVAEGLRARMRQGNGGITILSCDNLQHNGHTAQKAFTSFIQAQDSELADWMSSHVTFPNSMVDRITPSTTPADIERLNQNSGIQDLVPVYCEDFIQWVIEDDFVAGRPAWDLVGVQFTDDVSAFENMKLSLLNASHTLLSYPSFLKGYRAVDQAMQDQDIRTFVQEFMDKDVTPYVPAPPDTDLTEYKQILIERFSNSAVSDQVSRLCFDGISKFPVYIMPTLAQMIRDDQDLTRMAFLFAVYRHYLKYQVDDTGQAFVFAEPWLTPEDQLLLHSENPVDFLGFSAFKSVQLKASDSFVESYHIFVVGIKEHGVAKTLSSILFR
ncbi:mannitol 2-dehydrogenase [Dyadobacter jejuensis]|uniref:Mannitol 2-dehydrogenase n=1 Tax=Dyadobacter jejuensis TaxID=1082580 RepID=A0A316B3B9_9BACT|nr:mannitol dehydrogenase family protein [Dyadobacter jejuensis]PWJ57057.1 mannitol 2-dehydrogenase [Dyadobacter jejuensis]